MKKIITLTAALCIVLFTVAQGGTRLLRFPAVYDDQVIFAGDLYVIPVSGDMARTFPDKSN